MTLDLKLGDAWPFESVRGIVGAPCTPRWHALITPPQKEAATAQKLERAGCDVEYPKEERVRHIAGKKHTRQAPMMPGIIYVKFCYEPNWDVMRRRRVISGVFSRHGRPVELKHDDVLAVMGLPTEAEKRRGEELAAVMPVAGEKGVLTQGPFSGFMVDVEEVAAGRVWYKMVTDFGVIRGEDTSGFVQRVAS